MTFGTRWRIWSGHCATSRPVAGSIPDGVSGIFHRHNPSGRTMALGSTQPRTKIKIRNISWGVLATLPPSSAVGQERVELYLYSRYGPYGLYRASVPVQGCTFFTGDLTTFMCRLSWNLAASTSGNPQGLSRSVQGLLYLIPFTGALLPCVLPLNLSTFWGIPETTVKYNSNSTCGVLFEHLMFN